MKPLNFTNLNTYLNAFLSTPASGLPKTRKLLLVRSAESQGNLSGTLTGWTDVRLSDLGRKQAFLINQALSPQIYRFNTIFSSDLQRCVDTAFYALGFIEDEEIIKQRKELREINFGQDEGLHFDGLPEKRKQQFRDVNYKAEDGESWNDLKTRAMTFFQDIGPGHHLIFTHGGLICSCLSDHGVVEMVNNCSFVGVSMLEDGSKMSKVEFLWEFPVLPELS